jgi:ribokinase
MSSPIIVVGSSNVDLVMKMDRLPQRGETVTDAEFFQTFGGKGANQAVAAAKAGGDVTFINCVGNDVYGSQVVENLRQAGIDTQTVFIEPGVSTGTALIMIGAGGENYLGVAPGANYRLSPAHVEKARDCFTPGAVVLLQYEVTPDLLQFTLELARRAGCRTMLNLAPPRPFPVESFTRVDILVVNETEAAFQCGFPVEDETQAWRAVEALQARGVAMVILTLGANGCLFATRQNGSQDRQRIPAFKVAAVDTTAAGDVFCGALAVALTEGQPVPQALRFASAAAAVCVTRIGAQPSIPGRAEIEAFLSAH